MLAGRSAARAAAAAQGSRRNRATDYLLPEASPGDRVANADVDARLWDGGLDVALTPNVASGTDNHAASKYLYNPAGAGTRNIRLTPSAAGSDTFVIRTSAGQVSAAGIVYAAGDDLRLVCDWAADAVLYVNDVEVARLTPGGSWSDQSSVDLYVGADSAGGSLWQGTIDRAVAL